MHKIDGSGHVNNLFVEGNPAIGQAPTVVTAKWLNAVQAELVNVIEGAGIGLNDGVNTQLRQAIIAMITAANGAISDTVSTALAAFEAQIDALAAHVTQIGEGKYVHAGSFDATYYRRPENQVLLRADYPELWAKVQASGNLAADAADKATNATKWGRGDGVTTFQMPDDRGVFYRVDANGKAGSVAPALGVFKGNQNKRHRHPVPTTGEDANGNYIANASPGSNWSAWTEYDQDIDKGDEANPDHTTVIYVIRVK